MTSPPPPGSQASPRYNSFRNVVDAVSSSFRKSGSHDTSAVTASATATGSTHPAGETPPNSQSHPQLLHSAWQTAPWTQDQFPTLDAPMIKSIWRGEDAADENLRHCISKSIEEMQLNWSLDPKLVGGQRSEANQGNAAIVAFLQRLALEREQSGTASGSRSKILQGGGVTSDDDKSSDIDHHMGSTAPAPTRPGRSYERHDLLRAIERQDHETILEIRNANFDLLLDAAPGTSSSSSASASNAMQTPLGYAISLGPKFTGTAVVLTGAMSKYVNTLPDEQVFLQSRTKKTGQDFDPRTMERLRKLRGTLKLAVE